MKNKKSRDGAQDRLFMEVIESPSMKILAVLLRQTIVLFLNLALLLSFLVG